jgi:hypothetical protein
MSVWDAVGFDEDGAALYERGIVAWIFSNRGKLHAVAGHGWKNDIGALQSHLDTKMKVVHCAQLLQVNIYINIMIYELVKMRYEILASHTLELNIYYVP